MKTTKQIAVVTGGNRGMGFETCRQLGQRGYQVILTSRNPEKGERATENLQVEGWDVLFHQLDVTKEEESKQLAEFISRLDGELAVLVNNAGVLNNPSSSSQSLLGSSVFQATTEEIRLCFETNSMGALIVTKHLVSQMQEYNYGRIVNISSGMGALTDMNGGWAGYRISKTALNAVTRIFADELKGSNIKINSACPGWVRTEMGSPNATRSVEEGVGTAIWLATLPDDGPSGGFFRDCQPIDW